MNEKTKSHPKNCWVYAESYSGERILGDCRLQLVTHIDWKSSYSSDITDWQTPEPDNYNLAVFARLPLDCPFVANQVFYLDKKHKGWFSVCCETDAVKIADYINWAQRQPIIAYWHYQRAHKIRQRRKILENGRNNSPHLTMDERLFQLNYFDKLKYKCDNEFIVERRIGKPRLVALQVQQEAELDYNLED